MRALKRPSRDVRTQPELDEEPGSTAFVEEDSWTDEDADPEEEGTAVVVRVYCPDCARPIALLADEPRLPQHALCRSPWDPFGLTVCAGSGRAVAEAAPLPADRPAGQDMAVLLTLPVGLDWRTQPFSHAGRPVDSGLRRPA